MLKEKFMKHFDDISLTLHILLLIFTLTSFCIFVIDMKSKILGYSVLCIIITWVPAFFMHTYKEKNSKEK